MKKNDDIFKGTKILSELDPYETKIKEQAELFADALIDLAKAAYLEEKLSVNYTSSAKVRFVDAMLKSAKRM